MKQAVFLFVGIGGAVAFCVALIGAEAVLATTVGAIALMALLISGTFLWLWRQRATPLALGMALSWAGLGVFMALLMGLCHAGAVDVTGMAAGDAMILLLALSLLIAGAVLHFSVIQGSFDLGGLSFLWPVCGSFALSWGSYLLF